MSDAGTSGKDYPERRRREDARWMGEETISLMGAIKKLYRYRRTIGGVGIVFSALYSLLVLALFLWTPVLTRVSMEFQLTFEGVEADKYPNGMEFSIQDIVSTPVLSTVYESNGLESVLSLQEFLDSIYVSRESASVELLDDEYRGKLADLRLNLVDRLRLEDEYRTKRGTLKSASYSVNFLREQSVVRLSTSQIKKILGDILAGWADFVDQRKGVLEYQIPTYSRNAVQDDLMRSQDYIVMADLLRSKIELVLESVDLIGQLPGADVIRVGEEKISLAEVRLALDDTLNLSVGPLLEELRVDGILKDPSAVLNYFNARVYDIGLQSQQMGRRIDTLRDALDQYLQDGRFPGQMTPSRETDRRGALDAAVPTMIPQLDSSFLDRLLEMNENRSDLNFRQQMTERIVAVGLKKVALEQEHTFYRDMVEDLSGRRMSQSREGAVERVEAKLSVIVSQLLKALDQLQLIYVELSAKNLNPRTLLYSISGTPEVVSERSISVLRLILAGAVVFCLLMFVTVLSCLVHDALKVRNRESGDFQGLA